MLNYRRVVTISSFWEVRFDQDWNRLAVMPTAKHLKPKWGCISNCVGWIEMGNDVQALSFLKARLGFRKHLFWKGTP